MYNSGDAAEQVLRMTLQGVEVTAKITGHAAKNIALLIYSISKEQEKTKGKTRLENMLKSSKPLKVFSVKETDLKKFTAEAKRYGVLYCALRSKSKSPDGMVDIMVRVEDASKIHRITERFKFSAIDTASVKSDIEKGKSEKQPEAPEKDVPNKEKSDAILADLDFKPIQKDGNTQENPKLAKTEKPQSEPTSKTPKNVELGTSDKDKPSVKKEIEDIKKSRKKEAEKVKETGQEVIENTNKNLTLKKDTKERT